jgi:hypothetical protein
MPDQPRKNTGETGPTRVTAGPEGMRAEIVHTALPSGKEELERFFATRFTEQFNAAKPLSGDIVITDLSQNDTADLDFKITCAAAEYLELAELNPRSEEFGRIAYRTGELNVLTYAKWIYNRIVKKKARHYGQLANKTFLLLYVTHWQFLPSQRVFECVRSYCQHVGCPFVAVFFLITDGADLRAIEMLHPYIGPSLPAPNQYSTITLTNLPPGQSSWRVDTS